MHQRVCRNNPHFSIYVLTSSSYRITLNENEKSPEDPIGNEKRLKACHQRCADRTLKVLETNGSIFIKLGQHLSAMQYLLPEEYCKTLNVLQDHCPVSSYESIERLFFNDTGMHIHDYFSEFAEQPVGAASLAQVHVARIKENGQQVAVKVQHLHLGEWASLDLALTRFTFRTLKIFFPEYNLEWLSKEMDSSLPQELDFAREGQNAVRAKEYFAKLPNLPVVVPDVVWGKRRILVMDYVAGRRPDDLHYIDSNGLSRDEVSAALARIFNEMIFGTDAPLHCDPHGGNIAVRKNPAQPQGFDIIIYDHGLYRDVPLQTRRSYAHLWISILDKDEEAMRKWSYEVAGVEDDDFRLFASAITGRDYKVLEMGIETERTQEEKKEIGDALGEGMLSQLVQLLGKVPPIILLILKTNDLTRSLDEGLETRQGPARVFLILARYCARTIWCEKLDIIRQTGSLLKPSNLVKVVSAWFDYARVVFTLEAFEKWLSVKRVFGYSTELGGSNSFNRQ